MDKRTSRREYCDSFSRAVKFYRDEHYEQIMNQIRWVGQDTFIEGKLTVMVRKRPIFNHELQNSEFDVITCLEGNNICVHDARMQKDMKNMFMNHYEFTFDVVFDEKTTNEEVYKQSTAPLLKICKNGGFCTCMVYGQTGSGKTFTMSSIYQKVAFEIFSDLGENGVDSFSVSLTMIEVAGDQCHDLLNSFNSVQLLTGSDGAVHAYPLVEPKVNSAEELFHLIKFGCGVRSTAATGVHDTSSRSHAILKVFVRKFNHTEGDGEEGVLTLVDLAGFVFYLNLL